MVVVLLLWLVELRVNLCIDATERAAFDLGFTCIVTHDTSATRDLEFNGTLPVRMILQLVVYLILYGYNFPPLAA